PSRSRSTENPTSRGRRRKPVLPPAPLLKSRKSAAKPGANFSSCTQHYKLSTTKQACRVSTETKKTWKPSRQAIGKAKRRGVLQATEIAKFISLGFGAGALLWAVSAA